MPGSDAGTGSPDPKVAAIAAGAVQAMASNKQRLRLLTGIMKALEQSERVRALVFNSATESAAESALMDELDLDPLQARYVLDMQFRLLHAARRQAIADEHAELLAAYAECESIAASRELQEALVGTEKGAALLRRAGIDADGRPL